MRRGGSANSLIAGWMIAACAAVVLAGCGGRDASAPTKAADAQALHTEVERGPVKVAMDVVPREPRLSDEPELTLTVTAADGVTVSMPPFGESLGEFVIRDFHEPLPRTSDGRQILQQVYVLEPARAGTLTIDPLTIRFTDERSDGDGREHEVQTEALRLTVETMIADEAPSLDSLRPVAAPVPLPDGSKMSLWWLIAAALSALAVTAVLIWKLRRRTVSTEPQLTPQQLAWREMNDLLSSRLSESDVKEFFVRLTAVVRRYIERTTGINAPDQTTEEFLREMNDRKLFGDGDNARLEAFLESADLVKFAGYQPDAESIRESTHRARQFIELQTGQEYSDPTVAEATG